MQNREEIPTCRIVCPECGCVSHILDWRPGRCPGCRADHKYYTSDDLQVTPGEPVRIALDVLSGKAVVMEESA